VWSGAATSLIVGLSIGVVGGVAQDALDLTPMAVVGLWMLLVAAGWALLGALNKLGMLR
jgi:uncharacterized membrane protein